MSSTTQSSAKPPPADPQCLLQSMSGAFGAEPALEAVTIDRARQKISVATLGRTDEKAVQSRVSDSVELVQAAAETQRCALLEGEPNCDHCEVALPPAMRRSMIVEKKGDATTIARVTCPTAPKFWRWRDLPMPKFVPREVEIPEDDKHLNEWKGQLVGAVLCGLFGLIAWRLGSGPAGLAFHLLAYLAGAWFVAEEMWELLREGTLDVHFLMLAVAAGSASIGAWNEGSTLLFLFSLSGALEHYAMGRTQREIRSLFKNAPKVAILIDENGKEREVTIEKLRPGMRLLIKPDAQFPVDAEVAKGSTASDESNLTGESTPVEKTIGDSVLAGTLNLWGAVEVVVTRPASESALEKIIRLIREAQKLKAPSQRFTDKFGGRYTYGILSLSLVMFFVWWLGAGRPPFTSTGGTKSAFYLAMTLLVVASPCALVLSIPSAVLAAIAWGARRGILFRGGAAVEELGRVKVVALDKTGTLTSGELQIERVESIPSGREKEIVTLAYSLERLSTHPLARAIARHGKHEQLPIVQFERFESLTGEGLRAEHEGRQCWLGSRKLIEGQIAAEKIAGAFPAQPGFSEVWLSEGDLIGRILLRDDIRPQAAEVLRELELEGLHAVVLTGDRKESADILQEKLKLKDVRAGLRPEQKVAAIQAFGKEGKLVAMVGDGVNDAPSLAAAHVGVAMGARGSDAALEQASVVLMHDRLENFLAAYRLSKRARAVIQQNLVISLGTVVVLVSFALLGKIPLTLGVVGHEGSTVIVVMNSLRLLFSGREAKSS